MKKPSNGLLFGIAGAVVGGGLGAGITYYICQRKVKALEEELADAYEYIEASKEYDVRNTDLYVHGGTIELAEGEDGTDAVNEAKEKLRANWEGKVAYQAKFNSGSSEISEGDEVEASRDESEEDDDDPGGDDEEDEIVHPVENDRELYLDPETMEFGVDVEVMDGGDFSKFVKEHCEEDDAGEYSLDYVEYFESSGRFRVSDPYSPRDHEEIPKDGYAFGDVLFGADWFGGGDPYIFVVNHTLKKCYDIMRIHEVQDDYDIDSESLKWFEEDEEYFYEGGFMRHCPQND